MSALIAALALVGPGCGINKGAQDATSSSDGDEDATSDGNDYVVDDCEWVPGAWTFHDCDAPDGFGVSFASSGECVYQASGQNELIVGATASAKDSGFLLTLNDGKECLGFWDGTRLSGSCSSSGLGGAKPCWFYADKDD